MKSQTLLILLLISILMGCNRGQEMLVEEPVSQEQSTTIEEPTELIEYEIDGVQKTIAAFTSAQAAFDSEQFVLFLSWAKAYNEKNCGMDVKDGLSAEANNHFQFSNEDAALEFASKVAEKYPQDIADIPTNRSVGEPREQFPWWYATPLPRCFPH